MEKDVKQQVLHEENDYAKEIAALSKSWSFKQAADHFYNNEKKNSITRPVKTIGTFYHKMYDGGVERVLAELMNFWVKNSYNVVLFTEEEENELDFPYPKEVKRVIIPATEDMYGRLRALKESCETEHIDIYINHEWGDQTFIWECMLMRKMDIPYLLYCHTHFTWYFGREKEYYDLVYSLKLCDAIIALTEVNARFYQLCGCNTYLVQNPVPEDLISSAVPSDLTSNHILMIGRLSKEKNPLETVRIFKTVHKSLPNTVLDIVGDGDSYEDTANFIKENNLESSVILHGRKNNREITEFYKKSSCILYTSRLEGYPMMLMEAKAYGLPVVMYKLPYLTITRDGKGILTAPAGDIRKMADNLIKVMSDAELRNSMGKEARESFGELTKYDLKGAWDDILKICYGDMNSIGSKEYYYPEDIPEYDKLILPALFDRVKEWYDNTYETSREFRTGKAVLKYPRMIKSFFRTLKEKISGK